MFKTMDDTTIYDQQDIDSIVGVRTEDELSMGTVLDRVRSNEHRLTEAEATLSTKASTSNLEQTDIRVTALETDKANKSEVNSLANSVTALETNKADKSEVSNLVNRAVDSVIGTKVEEVATTFGSTIDAKVESATGAALQNYDDSNTVDSKISTAINNIPSGPVAMTTTEATALIDQYF